MRSYALRQPVVFIMCCIVAALVVGGGLSVYAQSIRQSPLDTVSVCDADEYATKTVDGIVCKSSTDTWTNQCATPADCCDSGEFLKITPDGLACFPSSDTSTIYTIRPHCYEFNLDAMPYFGVQCVVDHPIPV